MTLQSVRIAFIAVLALLIGAGHAACACMIPVEQAHPDAALDMPMAGQAAHHEHVSDHDRSDHRQHAPCNDEMSDCTHCVTASITATSPSVPFIAIASNAPHPESTPVAAFAIPPPRAAKLKQHRFQRWRAPLRLDPVSQKIRLLI